MNMTSDKPTRGGVALVEPLAIIDGRPAHFLRDAFGGEVPLSCAYPPLELAWTAALLRQQQVPVSLVAANVFGLDHHAVAQRLALQRPDFVLAPSAWGSIEDDLKLMTLLRKTIPDAQLMLSGPNVTADPGLALNSGVVDAVILGEPEEAVAALANGTARPDVPNLAWLDGGDVVSSTRRLPPNFGDYPLPARDLLDLSRYHIPFSRRHPATTMVTARGCPHYCTFCPSQLWFQHTVRPRPIDAVAAELDELTGRYGVREVIIRDETFTWDHDRVFELCDLIRRRGYDLTWRCFATTDTVTPEVLQAMGGAGCTQICYGFESGVDDILQQTGKKQSAALGRAAAAWTHEAGIEVAGTFVLGLEGETRETVERTVRYALDLDLDYVQVNAAAPLPGTGFGRRHERKGRKSAPQRFRWHGEDTGETAELDGASVAREVRRFYRRFYLRPRYIASRLSSGRGLRALASHAVMATRLVRAVVGPTVARWKNVR